jgi:hypothetical protein
MRDIPIPMRLDSRERLQFRFYILYWHAYFLKTKGCLDYCERLRESSFQCHKKNVWHRPCISNQVLARTLLDSGCSADSLASWHSTWEGRDRRPYSLCISELQCSLCAGGFSTHAILASRGADV